MSRGDQRYVSCIVLRSILIVLKSPARAARELVRVNRIFTFAPASLSQHQAPAGELLVATVE